MKDRIHRPGLLPIVLGVLALLAPGLPVVAGETGAGNAPDTDPARSIRFIEAGTDGGALETAIKTFEGPGGARVSLIAAVHVADRRYYLDLSRSFEAYDALLYEMVKPAGAVPRAGGRSGNIISIFQRGLKDVLGLEHQLDVIDYERPNFVHADMDLETFEKMQSERGEGLFSLMLRSIADDLRRAANGKVSDDINPYELMGAFLSRDRSRRLKLILGRHFEDIEARAAGLEGKDGTVILTERNKVAIEALKRTLAEGKRRIGIFYGAVHLAELEVRLAEMGFRRTGTIWLVAWDIAPREGKAAPASPASGRARRV